MIHTMHLEQEHEGTQVWVCDQEDCKHMLSIEWEPKFRKATIQQGKPVIHTGWKQEGIINGN